MSRAVQEVRRAIASKFGSHNSPRRAPTRGAPTDCLLSAFWPGEGTHKGCPYRLSSLGVLAWGGHPQGVPLPIVFSRRFGLGRAPTRGAPTDCLLSAFGPGKGTHKTDCLLSAFWPGEGTHKGCPYRLSSLGVLAWGGHPQGAPLPIVFSRRSALGRAPTRGAPTDCLLSAFWPWGGHPQGVPLPIVFSRRFGLGRAPTRGAPTDCLLSAYWPWGGHPQEGRLALGRAHKGCPYTHKDCLLSAFGPGKGTHKGCPYRLSSLGVWPWEGHPQGAPLPDSGSLTRFFLI